MRKEAVYYRKTEIKEFKDFKEGDCICEVCNGWGYFYDCYDNRVSQCYHCLGIGKLDWIANVTGVTNIANNGMASSSSYGSSGTSGVGSRPGSSGASGFGSRPSQLPPPPTSGRNLGLPPPPKRQIPAARSKIIPQKVTKKISWKQKFMNAVADK